MEWLQLAAMLRISVAAAELLHAPRLRLTARLPRAPAANASPAIDSLVCANVRPNAAHQRSQAPRHRTPPHPAHLPPVPPFAERFHDRARTPAPAVPSQPQSHLHRQRALRITSTIPQPAADLPGGAHIAHVRRVRRGAFTYPPARCRMTPRALLRQASHRPRHRSVVILCAPTTVRGRSLPVCIFYAEEEHRGAHTAVSVRPLSVPADTPLRDRSPAHRRVPHASLPAGTSDTSPPCPCPCTDSQSRTKAAQMVRTQINAPHTHPTSRANRLAAHAAGAHLRQTCAHAAGIADDKRVISMPLQVAQPPRTPRRTTRRRTDHTGPGWVLARKDRE
ncbi:hypothetical protein C8R47DRAFT_1159489 [Mycena vitilis]|nr:hypothetical protein C8R47DRAFT_1159489 [Mycena vitilis]